MASESNNAKYVCHVCICEDYLATEVKKQGAVGYCSYCGKEGEVVTLDDLAGRIHDIVQRDFRITPMLPVDALDYLAVAKGDWERRGDSAASVIAELAGLPNEVAHDLQDLLMETHDYEAIKYGAGEPLYDTEAMYEPRIPDDSQFQVTWKTFREQVQTRARFFGPEAEEMLHFIFGDLTSLTAFDRRPVIRGIGPGAEAVSVWRARVAQSIEEVVRILKSPSTELGPPPPKSAVAGRMNPDGIPVFYGATELETCVSEVRPPVGSFVVVSRFDLLKKVRILDLDALSLVYPKGSVFDPGYTERAGRAAFLGHLRNEIGRPVMPQNEALEYVATQAVAEYLAHKVNPRIDGIIFESSQTGGTGKNLVLFNHACMVEPYIVPRGTTVEVSAPDFDDLENTDIRFMGVNVLEVVPSDSTTKNPQDGADNMAVSQIQETREDRPDKVPDDSSPILRLDIKRVCVLPIKGVTYGYTSHAATRRRQPEKTGSDFDTGMDDASVEELLGGED